MFIVNRILVTIVVRNSENKIYYNLTQFQLTTTYKYSNMPVPIQADNANIGELSGINLRYGFNEESVKLITFNEDSVKLFYFKFQIIQK